MQPNVIVAESIGHRGRFAWLLIALAATVALLAVSQRSGDGDSRGRAALVGRSLRVHQCGRHRWHTRVDAERAERRARRAAERAAREAERAARAADWY